jgi:hypothetical protein
MALLDPFFTFFGFGRQDNNSANPENRVASRGKRDPFSIRWGGQLLNPDLTLRKFGTRDGIGLYDRILQQFPFITGYCEQWVDHVLATDRQIKPAKADTPDRQALADAAAVRAQRAWGRVQNRVIVLRSLLMGRFYGFATAEKVLRYDPVVQEWIEDLYDVPQNAWTFGDDGRDFLHTTFQPFGFPVERTKFLHFQWGSADTKYGAGELSRAYRVLFCIQQIEEYGMQAVEDYSRLIAIAHVPRSYSKEDRAKYIASVSDQYRYYVTAPTDETKAYIELPTINVTSQGAAGRQEYEVVRFYERWLQILLLGAPQTQDKALGTGKLEDTRKDIWHDKTPLGSSALDQCLTEGWLDSYYDRNMADLPVELRGRFDSDSAELSAGISGPAAQNATDIGIKLAANQLTATFATEMLIAIGIPRVRATAMVDSIMKERDNLVDVATLPKGDAPDPSAAGASPAGNPPLPSANAGKIAIWTDRGIQYFDKGSMVPTKNRGHIAVESLEVSDEIIVPRVAA